MNNMGFPSVGYRDFYLNLIKPRMNHLMVGVSIAGNDDCIKAVEKFYPLYATNDIFYLVINTSSPSVKNLRQIEVDDDQLIELIDNVVTARDVLSSTYTGKPMPIALKISPDLTRYQMEKTAEIAKGLWSRCGDCKQHDSSSTSKFEQKGLLFCWRIER